MKKDTIFRTKLKSIPPFQFDEKVAKVFDNMVSRSVPFYEETIFLIGDILKNQKRKLMIYDLGCSTGTTIHYLDKHLTGASFIGIDNSPAMIEKAKKKLKKCNAELLVADINEVDFKKCDAVIMNYTLQFLPVKKRALLLKKIYHSLRPGGIFILSEKLIAKDSLINDLLVELYYEFKERNGYSKLEIAQKREALLNFLVPLTQEHQLKAIKGAGFKKSELIFRWYNFSTFIGIK